MTLIYIDISLCKFVVSPTGDTGKYRLHFTLLDELFFCIVDVCLFSLNC
jgi:hypothetical protein